MTTAHRREKQPEQVRRALLDQAARCAIQGGLAGVSLQTVAEAASVTKGGLLHHFPSKQALVEAMFGDLLAKLDDEIDRLMQVDDQAAGSFTRAYIEAFFQVTRDGPKSPWAAISISCMSDPRLRDLWSDWTLQRRQRHPVTDGDLGLELVRYAVDGIWLANLTQADEFTDEKLIALRDQLIGMTRQEEIP